MNILIEATGSLTSGYLIKNIQTAGHKAVGSDISEFNHGKVLCDDFILMPKVSDPNLWEKKEKLLLRHKIDIVIPSLDETLLEWSKRVDYFRELGIHVILSNQKTIEIFQDKWLTYLFFEENKIRTPKTSLNADYDLIKPRLGRGGSGIFLKENLEFSMEGMISQEKINGIEYTVDVFYCKDGNPIYIVPRKRVDVKDGKSTKGVVVKNDKIDDLIKIISKRIKFTGPVNFQLFETNNEELIMIEVNPRIAGGMALGFEATENWIPLIVENILNGKTINDIKPINYGLKMVRYYAECFI